MRASEEKDIDEYKIIKNLDFKKKGVVKIVFDDETVLPISEESYLNNYLYSDKKLSSSEIESLKKESQLIEVRKYLNRILANRYYCSSALSLKLKKRYKLSDKDIDNLFLEYAESGLIDDERYAKLFIDDEYEKGYHIDYILKEIQDKDIDVDDSIYDYIHYKNYYMNTIYYNRWIDKLFKRYSNFTLKKRKEKIISFFQNHYHLKEDYINYLNDYFDNLDENLKKENDKLEKKELLSNYNKFKTLAIKKGLDKYESKQYIINKLMSKGYSYSQIKENIDFNEA